MNDGNVKIGIDVEDKKARDNLEKLKQDLQDLGGEVSKTDQKKMGNLAKEMEETSKSVQDTITSVKELDREIGVITSNLNELASDGALGDIMPESTLTFAEHYNNLLDEAIAKKRDLSSEAIKISDQQLSQNNLASSYLDKTQAIRDKVEGIANDTGKASGKTKVLDKEAKKVSSSMNSAKKNTGGMTAGIAQGVKSIMKYSLALFGIRSIFAGLKKLSKEFFDSNDQAVLQMKSNLGALSNGLTQLIAPALRTIIGWVTTLMGYVNALTKAFFGVELFTKKTAKNTGGMAGGVKDTNKEMKKLVASFDEAEVISSNMNDNMNSGGGGGVAELPEPKIPEPDVSGIINAFDKVMKKLKPFTDIIKSIDFKPLQKSLEKLGSSTLNILGIIGNSFANILNDSVAPFIKIMTEELVPTALLSIASALDMIAPHLEWFLTEVIEPLFNWLMLEFVPPVFELLTEAFNLLIPVLDKFLEGVKVAVKVIEPFVKILGVALLGAIGVVTEAIKWLTEEISKEDSAIGDLIKVIGFVVGAFFLLQGAMIVVSSVVAIGTKIFGALQIAIQTVIFIGKLLVAFFSGAFAGSIGAIIALVALLITGIVGIATNFEQIKNDLFRIVGNIKGIFGGLLEFIKGVFTGDWKRAWQGIVQIFDNIIGGVANIFKFPINIIIDGMNAFIRGLNKIKIPSWVPGVGGKGINIGQIPRLAKGGVLNKPTLNIAGEAGKEAVVPLENNTGWINDFIDLFNANGGNKGNGSQVIQVMLPNGKVLAEVVNEQNEQSNFNMNGGGFAWNT